jgi:hypothetical protein
MNEQITGGLSKNAAVSAVYSNVSPRNPAMPVFSNSQQGMVLFQDTFNVSPACPYFLCFAGAVDYNPIYQQHTTFVFRLSSTVVSQCDIWWGGQGGNPPASTYFTNNFQGLTFGAPTGKYVGNMVIFDWQESAGLQYATIGDGSFTPGTGGTGGNGDNDGHLFGDIVAWTSYCDNVLVTTQIWSQASAPSVLSCRLHGVKQGPWV